jgi:hypothetical protein
MYSTYISLAVLIPAKATCEKSPAVSSSDIGSSLRQTDLAKNPSLIPPPGVSMTLRAPLGVRSLYLCVNSQRLRVVREVTLRMTLMQQFVSISSFLLAPHSLLANLLDFIL